MRLPLRRRLWKMSRLRGLPHCMRRSKRKGDLLGLRLLPRLSRKG
jgi:hypothetical protein